MPKLSKKNKGFNTALIAPCGLNCRLCQAYIREKSSCPGCRGGDKLRTKTRVECRIKNCENLYESGAKYCFQCDRYPCEWLNHLDKRYRTKYGKSIIDNLNAINKIGIRPFIQNEKERWTCPNCGEIICVHKPNCLYCGAQRF
jgi:hypothetical protein